MVQRNLKAHGGPLVVVSSVAPVVEHVIEDAWAPQHLPPGPVGHPWKGGGVTWPKIVNKVIDCYDLFHHFECLYDWPWQGLSKMTL